ncbi:MAG TPA: hypothetical protein VE646_02330 [Actinomycetota bacterium]|jgi:hypothetical protein|nr:hypothetical protein [Actinomycetota bacterium]
MYPESYTHLIAGSIPRDTWQEAWYSISTWKGYLQSFPGFLRLRVSIRELEGGDIRVAIATIWEHEEQLDAWLGGQWRADRILQQLSTPAYDVTDEILADLS